MIRIRVVKPLKKFRVRLELTNGKNKIVDLDPYLRGPIFEPLRSDRKLFSTVSVDPDLGTIVWKNGADIDPDVLIEGCKSAWMEKTREALPTSSRYKTTIETFAVKEAKKLYKRKK
ncbi:MAG: DUF2442 domain-containing protein [bacterium]